MIFLVLVIVALAAVSFVAIGVAFANKNRFPSNLISWCTVRKNTSIRGHFMRYQWTKDLIDLSKLPCNHSHPDAAGERDELSLRVTDFIEKTNGLRYDISMSRREIRSGVDGERFYYSPGDLSCPVMQSEITDNHVVTLCDVDYYLTETEFVGKVFGRKVLMNTFVPSALSGTIPNGRFHYVDANTVETVINGGARYYHKLYEYDKSFLTIRQWPRICFYNVDIVVINEHRNVVLLTPFAITFDPFGFAWWWLEAGRYSLRHDHVTRHGNVLTSRYLRDKKYYRSMMTVGDTVSVEIPERTFLAIKILFDVAKSSNVSDVEKFLRLQKFTPLQSAEFAPIIFRTLKQIGIDSTLSVGASTSVGDSDSTWSVGTAAPAYDTVVDGGLATDNEVRACNVSVVPPVVLNGGPSPVESYNNDLACVQQRVIAPHNVLEPDGLQCYAKEFLELLVRIDVVGCGVPWTSDSVMEKQDRPLQRHRSELQRHWRNDFLVVKAFQKKETYAKVSAPRNISTVTPSHTVGLSRFTYPFKKNILDYFDWYMPCRAPCEIVRRVRNYVQHRETVDCTDYSSFDGTNSRWLRENVELAAYLRWYPSEYHNEIRGYINAELDAAAVTSHGVRYKPDGSRLSGSPLTTDGNTMLNAFASYCGYRLAGFEPKRSFNTIGPKYGDDSIEDVRCQLDEVCRRIGFSIKHEVVTAGQPLPFLGRIFVNPWVSDNTVQDPMRTMIKIHQGFPDGKTTSYQTAINRCKGYLVTDSSTPLISHFCRKVIELRPGDYKTGIDKEMDMRVDMGPWPDDGGLLADKMSVVAKSCGLNVADLDAVITKIESWKSFDQFDVLINNPLIVNVTSVVNGILRVGDDISVNTTNGVLNHHKRRNKKK